MFDPDANMPRINRGKTYLTSEIGGRSMNMNSRRHLSSHYAERWPSGNKRSLKPLAMLCNRGSSRWLCWPELSVTAFPKEW